ncbi:DUF2563 family protein [Streptomyces sp. NPDC046161]|uniref:DUF2563 family protein n=1 Tax=Streptomyces sp. NPDC046161 TaxID=3155132 RepID=UPI0033E6851F
MAEENSGLAAVVGSANGVADAIMRQAKALEVEYETLNGFKKLVDAQLKKLSGSEADPDKLQDGTLPSGTLGTGFAEADALFKAYGTVHTQLTTLSKGLADQIEGLGIAILTGGKGFADVDEETRQRMLAIAQRAKEHYVAERDPSAKPDQPQQQHPQGGQTPTPAPSKSEVDY